MTGLWVIVSVYVGLSVMTEVAYLMIMRRMNRSFHKKEPVIRIVRRVYVGRPELDFDLHVKKVDKLRFGDEP